MIILCNAITTYCFAKTKLECYGTCNNHTGFAFLYSSPPPSANHHPTTTKTKKHRHPPTTNNTPPSFHQLPGWLDCFHHQRRLKKERSLINIRHSYLRSKAIRSPGGPRHKARRRLIKVRYTLYKNMKIYS